MPNMDAPETWVSYQTQKYPRSDDPIYMKCSDKQIHGNRKHINDCQNEGSREGRRGGRKQITINGCEISCLTSKAHSPTYIKTVSICMNILKTTECYTLKRINFVIY